MYTFIGTARNVRELIQLLSKTEASATLTFKGMQEDWDMVEVYVSEDGDDVMLK
jgi:hypothetical protein